MKKVFISIVFAIFMISVISAKDGFFWAGDIPFLKSIFIGDEEYVKQEILKCKDVEAVEMKVSYQDEDDLLYEIHIYLSNHRYLCFDDVVLAFYKRVSSNKHDYITLKQINDLAFIEYSFVPYQSNKDYLFYHGWRSYGEIRFLEKLLPSRKVENMFEVIENIDEVYDSINTLPVYQKDYSEKIPKFQYPYGIPFKLPEEFDNGIPVSAVVRKKVVDRQASTENWYEEAYKFYKLPIKEAKNQNIYISDY